MKLLSLGPFEGNAWLFGRKVERVLTEWHAPAKLAIVALPFTVRHEEYLAAIEEAAGIPVVGATTGGASFTERGFSRTGVTCAFLGGDDVEARCAVARDLRVDAAKSVRGALVELDEVYTTGARSGTLGSIFVLADPFTCDGEELVSCLRHNLAPHTRVFGGSAGDGWSFEGPRVFMGRKAISDGAVLVRLSHRQRINLDVLHGFRAAERGRSFTVTDIDRHVLKTLDNQPAAKVYEDELHRLGVRTGSEGLLQTMVKHALGANIPFGEELKIRTALGVRNDGSVVLTSSLPKGQVVRVMTAKNDTLIDTAKSLSTKVLGPLPELSGTLIFESASRLHLLSERYREQVRAFVGPGGHLHPMFGITCYGEFAKFGGCMEGFHNTSAVMVAW